MLCARDFKSLVSANSTTPAFIRLNVNIRAAACQVSGRKGLANSAGCEYNIMIKYQVIGCLR